MSFFDDQCFKVGDKVRTEIGKAVSEIVCLREKDQIAELKASFGTMFAPFESLRPAAV